MVWALLILVNVCLNLFHGTHLVSSFLDPHVTLNMSCCREASDCLLSWGLLVSVWTQRVVELPKAWRETVRQERLVASANIQHAGRWGREGKSFPVMLQPELYILWQGETFSGCICIWVGCVCRGFQGRALVFVGHISTKRGHERAGRDITEERARAEGRVLMGRFRHRAVKFHSTSIIPLTPRRVRSVSEVRARRADTLGHFLARGELYNRQRQLWGWILLPVMLGGSDRTGSKDLPSVDRWSNEMYYFGCHFAFKK